MKKAEEIASEFIIQERKIKWDDLCGKWTSNNDKATAMSLFNACVDEYKRNPSSDNYVLLTASMRAMQDVFKNSKTAETAINEQYKYL